MTRCFSCSSDQAPPVRRSCSTRCASVCLSWRSTTSTRSGFPPGADTSWRHRANEKWLRRALAYQGEGKDVLLSGQTPLGELLATPSAPLLEAVSGCLIDCDDETRLARLRARGPEWLARSGGDLQDYLNWAEWMRRHASDPAWRIDVIRRPDTEDEMMWERWSDSRAGDPRWPLRAIDTSALTVERVADQLLDWIEEERAALRFRSRTDGKLES